MPEYITRDEHSEFAKRIDEENDRQNHRLTELESAVKVISRLTTSVEKLAMSVERMAKEQETTNSRLTALEQEPAGKWRKLVELLIAAAVGFFIRQIGLG